MKTTSQNQIISPELINRSHHQSEQTETAAASTERKDNRLPIDSEARKQNRSLPTAKVLSLLQELLPDVYPLAEVVGRKPDSGWVWVHFQECPCGTHRQQLAQLGFHWNRERQTWQHPCGQFSLSSAADPHEKYSSYRPAQVAPKPTAATRARRSAKAKTQEAVAA